MSTENKVWQLLLPLIAVRHSAMNLRLFGDLVVLVDGRPAPPVRYRKSHWLLALLTLHRGQDMDRAWLSGLLWPDSSESQALYNLRRSLAELRSVLGPEARRLVASTPRTLALDLAGAQIDLVTFDAAISRGDAASLESAVELYRGPLLQQCHEEWASRERQSREEAYLKALENLAAHAAARGDHVAAVRCLRQVVAVDPIREAAQEALLKALVASDDKIGALMAYRAFRLRLYQEAHVEPSPEIRAVIQELRVQAHLPTGPGTNGERIPRAPGRTQGRTTEAVAAISAPRRLPHPVSPFVGRQEAIDTVSACLESARLVTLTGPGGVGKTRLAIQVAHGIADDHLDGAWFVDLSRLSDPTLVPQAVASVLAVQEQPERPLTETLAEHVQTRQLLLVLDNCEHLLPACAELVEALLAGSPALRVLATSRQSLGLTGEIAWPVCGLSVPPSDKGVGGSDQTPNPQPLTPDALLEFEAARLFVERARGAAPLFRLTERAVRSVGEICRRLEGIPLALELAAARLKSLSVEEIAVRLDDSFRLLTGGSRTAQPRQQTLRATMDWSYELLPEPERLLLQRLSVFAGSFSLQAVEGVCGDGRDGKRPIALAPLIPHPSSFIPVDLLDLLTQLVDKSLVAVEAGQETRYRLLETVRQYALERLQAGTSSGGEDEEARVRGRHLHFYLRLAEEAGPYVGGPDQAAWFGRLEVERDNLRTALDWAVEREPEHALRLAAALVGFWTECRCLEEGRRRLAAALAAAGPARHTPAGIRVLADLGWLAFLGDDFAAARPCFEEGLAVWRELGDPGGIADALWGLGHVARREQAYAEARALQEESLAIRRGLEDWPGIAHSLIGLGETLQEEGADPSTWAGYYEEALAIRRELGDRPGVAAALGQLANVAGRQGDYARARVYREESLAVWRALGSRIGVIHSFGALGHLARDQGEYAEARAFYSQSLHLRWELGDRYTLVQGLEDFAELAASEGDWARLTRLLGATEAQREAMARPLQPRERAEYERYLSRARAALGEAAVAAEGKAGRAMALEEAIAFALETGAS